jgi:hypothetical protein
MFSHQPNRALLRSVAAALSLLFLVFAGAADARNVCTFGSAHQSCDPTAP